MTEVRAERGKLAQDKGVCVRPTTVFFGKGRVITRIRIEPAEHPSSIAVGEGRDVATVQVTHECSIVILRIRLPGAYELPVVVQAACDLPFAIGVGHRRPLDGAQDQEHCEDGNEIGQSESSVRLTIEITLFDCEHRALRSIAAYRLS